MKIPRHIKFENNCEGILKQSVLAVLPEEGCALLLGNQKKKKDSPEDIFYEISLIWPCCNIWKPGIKNLPESIDHFSNKDKIITSKKNRFVIDPQEQLIAQKWGRKKNLLVLGSAHSHPYNLSIPSKSDLAWHFSTSLMVIVNSNGVIRAWWVKTNPTKEAFEIPCKFQKQNI